MAVILQICGCVEWRRVVGREGAIRAVSGRWVTRKGGVGVGWEIPRVCQLKLLIKLFIIPHQLIIYQEQF